MLPLVQDNHYPLLTMKAQAGRLQRCVQPEGPLSCSSVWRPWTTLRETESPQEKFNSVTMVTKTIPKVAHGFQHPVRLYMPKSRTHEYMLRLGKKVLASFPVQATLHFYNDDSSSEEEDEDIEEHKTYLHGLDHRRHPSHLLSS
ncbi:protein ripply3 [Hypomesus transpacificus]|uniref:protein ripply3 n=1 Tax=Hypomesus transpacificus TaxID=137520 RepID=UPI001F076008|nr:protein ripply3 [Hypomesus transpacificus]